MTNARTYVVVAATGLAVTAVSRPAAAIEPGEVPQTKSSIFIGSSADVPGPGIYMFDRAFTYQAHLVGLGAPHNNGFPNQTHVGVTDQVSSDTSSAAYHFANGGRFSDFAVGGLVAYDFGPATLSLVATDEVYAHTTGGTPGAGNVITPQGWTVFGEVSYKLCCFEEEAPVAPNKPMVYK